MLEYKGFKLVSTKTEYMGSIRERRNKELLAIAEEEVVPGDHFGNVGSIIITEN